MKVVTEDTLAHSRAFVFIIDQFAKLLKAGFGDTEFTFGNNNFVTYLYDETSKEVLSASVWSFDPTRRASTVHFSATAEEHRGKGYYKQVFAEVERRVKMKGAVALFSGVHVDNGKMVELAKQTGRQANWYRTKKVLR